MSASRMIVLSAVGFFTLIGTVSLLKAYRASTIKWGLAEGIIKAFDRTEAPVSGLRQAFQISATYEFSVDGLEYLGNRIQFDAQTVWTMTELVEALGSTEPTNVKVYYNLNDPSISVLIKPFIAPRWAEAGLSLLAAIGCWFVFRRMQT